MESAIIVQKTISPGFSAVEKIKEIKQFYRRAEYCLDDIVLFRDYFRFRGEEMLYVLNKFYRQQAQEVLDVGCGIGFGSALLSIWTGARVIGVDIKADGRVNSEIRRMSEFFNMTFNHEEKKQLNFAGASGEVLPFKDYSFDLVFSSFVLEHVRNKEKMIKEIKRVMKPGGKFIFLVPCFLERFYAIPAYYIWFARNALKALKLKINRNIYDHGENSGDSSNNKIKRSSEEKKENREKKGNNENRVINGKSLLKRLKTREPRFPFVPPHGEYGSSWEETKRHTVSSWLEIIGKAGMNEIKIEGINIVPTVLLDQICPGKRTGIFRFFLPAASVVWKIPVLKNMTYNICISGRR